MKKAILLGLDFIISSDGTPYFIEVNSSPGGFDEYYSFTGSTAPLEELAKAVLTRVPEPVAVVLTRKRTVDKEDYWKVEVLNRFFETYLAFIEDTDPMNGVFKSVNGKLIRPNVILFNKFSFAQLYSGDALQINPLEVLRITVDKHLCYLIAASAGVEIPRSFLALTKGSAGRIIKRIFKGREVVLKPNFGAFGRGVIFTKDPELRDAPSSIFPAVVQEVVTPRKLQGQFWDVRVLVIDGKVKGGFIRASEKRVVNIHAGGKPLPLTDDILKIVEKPAVRMAEAIDRVASAI